MDVIEALNAPIFLWTVIVFWAGYQIGSLRSGISSIKPIPVETITPQAQSEIAAAISKGHKIEAIRILRANTNAGLAEAKKTIDNWPKTVANQPR